MYFRGTARRPLWWIGAGGEGGVENDNAQVLLGAALPEMRTQFSQDLSPNSSLGLHPGGERKLPPSSLR